jgi:hypothetical protein
VLAERRSGRNLLRVLLSACTKTHKTSAKQVHVKFLWSFVGDILQRNFRVTSRKLLICAGFKAVGKLVVVATPLNPPDMTESRLLVLQSPDNAEVDAILLAVQI